MSRLIGILIFIFIYQCSVADGGGANVFDGNIEYLTEENYLKQTTNLSRKKKIGFGDYLNEKLENEKEKILNVPNWLEGRWDLEILETNLNSYQSNINLIYCKDSKIIVFRKNAGLFHLSDYVAKKSNTEIESQEIIKNNFYEIKVSENFTTNSFFYRFEKVKDKLYFSSSKYKKLRFKLNNSTTNKNKVLPSWVIGNWYNRDGNNIKVKQKKIWINNIEIKWENIFDEVIINKNYIFFTFKGKIFLLRKKSIRILNYKFWNKEIVKKHIFYKVTKANIPPQIFGNWNISDDSYEILKRQKNKTKQKLANRVHHFITNLSEVIFTTNNVFVDNIDVSKKDFYFFQKKISKKWSQKNINSFNFYFYYFLKKDKKEYKYFFNWNQIDSTRARLIFDTGEEVSLEKKGL